MRTFKLFDFALSNFRRDSRFFFSLGVNRLKLTIPHQLMIMINPWPFLRFSKVVKKHRT